KSGSKDKIAAVIKDNAYGHGIEIISKIVSEYGVKEAVVINLEEALKIKSYFKNTLILNDTPIANSSLSFAVGDIKKLLQVTNQDVKIELKIDSGMHRNGIDIKELPLALDIIRKKGLRLFGVFTHFKGADELDTTFAWQKSRFEEVKKIVINKGFSPRFHSYNSAALLRSKSFSEDIARTGIALYGYSELPSIFGDFNLKPVLSLMANRVSTRVLKKGQKVGYGGEFKAPKDMVVSTYDIGYGDGLFRGDAKNPLIIEEKLPILGRVSMDFITLESQKEEVCIFKDAKKVAAHFNTISYEILTSLNPTIKRVVI
ncbi:MAG: alanine racemase, partial [Epsilonproteobacteria bacterium]|nr:alanine racemase [Campylobacterota bacterium]